MKKRPRRQKNQKPREKGQGQEQKQEKPEAGISFKGYVWLVVFACTVLFSSMLILQCAQNTKSPCAFFGAALMNSLATTALAVVTGIAVRDVRIKLPARIRGITRMKLMKLRKILPGVLGIALLISGAYNYWQWSQITQQAANYTTQIAALEENLEKNQEEQTTLQEELEETKSDLKAAKKELAEAKESIPTDDFDLVYNEETGIYEPLYIVKERQAANGNPPQKEPAEGTDGAASQSGSGEVQTGSNGEKLYPNIMGGDIPSPLTPEEQKELMKILEEMGAVSGDKMQKGEASGGNVGENKGGNQSSSNTTGGGGLFWREKFDYPVEYKCEYRPQYYNGYLENPWFLLLSAEEQEEKMRWYDHLVSTGQADAPTAQSLKSREESIRKAYNAYKGTYQPRYPDTFLLLYRDNFQEKSAEEQEEWLRENDQAEDEYASGERKRPTINWN